MLNGIFTYNVDQKGRIVMPGRFLEEIGNPFVLGGTPGGYLVAVSDPKRLDDHAGVRGFAECRIKDRTGRFVIPSALREFADLHQTGEAAVIGVGDEVEIWNKRRWESQAKPPFPSSTSQISPKDHVRVRRCPHRLWSGKRRCTGSRIWKCRAR